METRYPKGIQQNRAQRYEKNLIYARKKCKILIFAPFSLVIGRWSLEAGQALCGTSQSAGQMVSKNGQSDCYEMKERRKTANGGKNTAKCDDRNIIPD
jgi:hypothetical protein